MIREEGFVSPIDGTTTTKAMKPTRNTWILLLLFALCVRLQDASAQTADRALRFLHTSEGLSPDGARRHSALLLEESSESVRLFSLEGDGLLLLDPEFLLPLNPNLGVRARTMGIEHLLDGSLKWQGTLGEDHRIVTLIARDGTLKGRFEAAGDRWRLEPVDHAVGALVRTRRIADKLFDSDLDFATTDEGAGDVYQPTPNARISSIDAIATGAAVQRIDVMVVYSDDAGASENMALAALSWVADVNSILNNGGIGGEIDLNLVHTMQVSVNEPVDCDSGLTALAAGYSPYGGVPSVRAAHGADIVVLAVNDLTGCFGKSAAIFANSAGEAYAVVQRSKSNQNRTFAHEIGHLIGGLHTVSEMTQAYATENEEYDPDSDPISLGTVPYAHGIQGGSVGGTVMMASGNRDQYYSRDGAVFSNSDPMGSEAHENVVLVWSDNAGDVAGLVPAAVEETNPPYVLEATLNAPSTMAWKENATLQVVKDYVPSSGGEVECTECTVKWYEGYSQSGPYSSYLGITTSTLYVTMNWTSGHGYKAIITDGIQTSADSVWIDYCASNCGGGGARVASLPTFVAFEASGLEVYPNPSGSGAGTSVSFSLVSSASVDLSVYDMLGRRVAGLIEGTLRAGHHGVVWTPVGVTSGVYVMLLTVDDRRTSRVVIRN